MIHRHRKQIAVLKMLENAQFKFDYYIQMISSGLNLKENLKRAKVMTQIEDRLLNYYYSL